MARLQAATGDMFLHLLFKKVAGGADKLIDERVCVETGGKKDRQRRAPGDKTHTITYIPDVWCVSDCCRLQAGLAGNMPHHRVDDEEQPMAGVMDSVNQRTQLVGQNRLELLLFRLAGNQLYGINVFKVKEVLQCPRLTAMPKLHPVVRGVAHIRGGTLPILDLNRATGGPGLDNLDTAFVIITEYNYKVQGFLVRSVERIVNMNWSEIHPPPKGTGREHYLTAVTRVDNQMVEIIDVEKVLAEVVPTNENISAGVVDADTQAEAVARRVLIVDDSSIARKQVTRCLQEVGVEIVALNDGRQALDWLKARADEGEDVSQSLLMMISDIEMPEMDGYTLTAEVRNDPRLNRLHIMLHTSLSGVFNQAMVKKVGADDFLAKFKPDDLAQRVIARLHLLREGGAGEA
tara:strand:- start:1773 stop:2984 length:1212 start_codon:yes stop_codon:yes gene_type:complete